MNKRASTPITRLTGLLQRSVRTLGSRKTPRSAGRLAGTGPDSAGPYAHEKPTKTGNVVGTPKPAIPRLELHVSTRVHRDATDRDALGLSRVLLTTDDPRGGSSRVKQVRVHQAQQSLFGGSPP